MIVLIVFAFIAGIVTILSPCILPVLPIVLSSTIGGQKISKLRPVGIVIGFVLSFTFFTLFLSTIVRLSGISADTLRLLSVIIIAGFGLSLLIPQFQLLLEQLFSKLARFAPQGSNIKTGFGSGLFIGVSLGLLWTPCVGPILASVISLAITGTVTLDAFIITLAYSLGTAIPMFLIMRGGQNILKKVPWLLANTDRIQKAFGIVMILTALVIFFNLDRKFQTVILNQFPGYGIGLTQFENTSSIKEQLQKLQNKPVQETKGKPMFEVVEQNLGNAPDFVGGQKWFNLPAGTHTLTLADLKGKVVVVDFWTYTCINCIRTLPFINAWHEKYKDKGLVIIGVHTPEFEFEKNADNVQKAIKDFKISYPVVQDNNYAIWNAYNNQYWPAKYFIDKDGKIRWTHFGEGKYDESEQEIQKLLAETGTAVDTSMVPVTPIPIETRSPETYLGYNRIEYYVSPEQIQRDTKASYTIPSGLPDTAFAYGGNWTINSQYAITTVGSALDLNFNAMGVYLVMRPHTGSAQVKVYLDGKLVDTTNAGEDVVNGSVTVNEDRLYRLIKLPQSGRHRLHLEFPTGAAELYAFTFG